MRAGISSLAFRAPVICALLGTAPAAAGPQVLAPERPIETSLGGGTTHRYVVEIGPGTWRVAVEQLGVDVVVEARDDDGGLLAVADLPTGRMGREILLLEPTAPARIDLEVRSFDGKAAPGRYRLVLERLNKEPAWLDAERAVAAAAAATARGEADADREAATLLAEAARAWRALGARRREAEVLHALAYVHRFLGEPRPAAERFEEATEIWRELGETHRAADALNGAGLSRLNVEQHDIARSLLEEAVALYAELGETRYEADARKNLGLLYQRRGELERAEAIYRQTVELLRAAPDRLLEDTLHNNLGGVYAELGKPELARRHYLAAFEIRRSLGDPGREAVILNNLASLDRYTGRWHDALERWHRALELFREVGHRRREAVTLHNLGYACLRLGELERAKTFFRDALTLRRAVEDRAGEANTLDHLATVYRQLGAVPAARAVRRKALALRRQLEDRRGEARTLVRLGRDALAEGAPQSALGHFDAALGIFRTGDVDDPRNAVGALAGRGRALAALGRTGEAAAALETALAEHRSLADRAGETTTRVALAELEKERGRLEAALTHAGEAIAGVEAQRSEIPGPELRAAFLASQRRAYELRTDLLVELARRGGGPALLEAALETAELARGRALIDLLAGSEIDPRHGVDPELRDRRRALLERLHLLASRAEPTDAEAVELGIVEAEIRRHHPAYGELIRPEPLTAGAVQELLDPGTTLLQYALGEERGILWRVTRTALEVHLLPPRSAVEDAARRAHDELAAVEVGRARRASALDELAGMVLGPVAEGLRGERLAIVADGALAYVPFAALPVPGTSGEGEPLLARFEVVQLPSASALAAQRRRPSPAPRLAAVVLADPIFHAGDSRVDAPPPGREDPPPAAGGLPYDRLPASRAEAERLMALLPGGEVRAVLGAEANRDAVLGGALAGARVVHLATHGVIDAVRPELSGLVLSRVDGRGRPRDGFLSLRDVFELELDAELVVLSGCRTALGKEVRGEGLVGLVHGFFYAGAPRVIASLWRVEDRATAVLMGHFYEALLAGGRRPAAALRAAQLAVRSERRWRDPSYWAGFVLQGDWR